jgi:dolichyl-phosphate beta-glucosyltransferase
MMWAEWTTHTVARAPTPPIGVRGTVRQVEAVGATTVCLVMPCFNERDRLRDDQVKELADDPRVTLVLVDDGSTDGTADVLQTIAQNHVDVSVVLLASNRGKGEAVRAGLQRAVASGAAWVGYVDADMATPAHEIRRLIDVATETGDEVAGRAGVDVVLGSRLALLGRDVRRSAFRHYTGRVFATLASLLLGKPVYDTQCGAKLLRRTDALEQSIVRPFRSRWAFDVELLGRLDRAGVPPERFWEEPLLVWHDVGGSRRTLRASLRASADLLLVWRDLRRNCR